MHADHRAADSPLNEPAPGMRHTQRPELAPSSPQDRSRKCGLTHVESAQHRHPTPDDTITGHHLKAPGKSVMSPKLTKSLLQCARAASAATAAMRLRLRFSRQLAHRALPWRLVPLGMFPPDPFQCLEPTIDRRNRGGHRCMGQFKMNTGNRIIQEHGIPRLSHIQFLLHVDTSHFKTQLPVQSNSPLVEGKNVEANAFCTKRFHMSLDRFESFGSKTLPAKLFLDFHVINESTTLSAIILDSAPDISHRHILRCGQDFEKVVVWRIRTLRQRSLQILQGSFMSTCWQPTPRFDVVIGIRRRRRRQKCVELLASHWNKFSQEILQARHGRVSM